MSHRIPRLSATLGVTMVAVSTVVLLAGLSTVPPAVAAPGGSAAPQAVRLDPLDPASLTAARREADRLRATMDLIDAQQDAAEERLAYVRDLLAAASTRAITTEQELAQLTEQTTSIGDNATERVRALYMSGGAPALYSTLLDGDDISDVLSRVTTVQDVLRGDDTALDDSRAELSAVTELRAQQALVARQRAQLSGEATALVRRLASLHRSATRALDRADARVERLAEILRKQRRAAAEAAAARALEAYGATPSSNRPASGTPYGDTAVAAALSKLGSPYVWGAEGPDTFDCSGLVQWAYAQAGLSLPRLASDQYFASRPVDVSQMLPGDVLVYAYQPGVESTIHHITMYIGNGQMVHAPHTGDVVRVVPVYFDGLYGVARPGLAP